MVPGTWMKGHERSAANGRGGPGGDGPSTPNRARKSSRKCPSTQIPRTGQKRPPPLHQQPPPLRKARPAGPPPPFKPQPRQLRKGPPPGLPLERKVVCLRAAPGPRRVSPAPAPVLQRPRKPIKASRPWPVRGPGHAGPEKRNFATGVRLPFTKNAG